MTYQTTCRKVVDALVANMRNPAMQKTRTMHRARILLTLRTEMESIGYSESQIDQCQRDCLDMADLEFNAN